MRSIRAYHSTKKRLDSAKSSISCNDLSLIPTDFQKFNQAIGLPINRNSGLLQLMTPFQIQYHNAIEKYFFAVLDGLNWSQHFECTGTQVP